MNQLSHIPQFIRVLFCLFIAALLSYTPKAIAQDGEVPRTRTFPGIENPAFSYAQPEEVGFSSEKLNLLGNEIASWVDSGELVGGELLIIKDGKAIFHESYGWSDREERRPMERGSLFSIKSMSKPFTATAILILEDEGKLSLEDLVSQYIPNFAGDERTTLKHLLAHTSGYEGLGFNVEGYNTLEKSVENWASKAPTQPFGEFSYSDFNYGALGYIVEIVAGVAIDKFIEERIILPLGLEETHTFIAPNAPWAAQANSRYRWNEEAADYKKYWSKGDQLGWAFYPAAWGLWATAMDYAEFLTLWMNGGEYNGRRLLPRKTVEKALRPHGLLNGQEMYGYGWFIETDSGSDEMPLVFQHGGYDGTLAMAFPADNTMVIYLTHSRKFGYEQSLKNRMSIFGSLEYLEPGMVRPDQAGIEAIELPLHMRTRYLGIYRGWHPRAEMEFIIHVWEGNDRLYFRFGSTGQPMSSNIDYLVPISDDRFILGRYDGGQLKAVLPYLTIRFVVVEGEANSVEGSIGGEIEFSAERASSLRR